MKTGIKKILRDINSYKGRTLLTLMGILIGIASVGGVLSSYTILNREMKRNFMDTNPASVVLYVSNLNDNAAQLMSNLYPNLDIECRKTIQARISRGDGTYGTIFLRAVQDFKNQKVDIFTLEKGSFPANTAEMAIERDCIKLLSNIKLGESINIKLPGGFEKELLLSGRVHAPGLPPASMENYSYGFLSLGGLKSLGYQGWYDEIRIVSYDNRFDRTKMEQLSQSITQTLTENGYSIKSAQVPVPGKHPHADQLNSLLFLLQAFAAISLLAACLIIINLINFIMSKQAKQIAIMKAVGASSFNIAVPYLFYVFIISFAALLISFPISAVIGDGYSSFAAGLLNFNIASYEVPFKVFLIQTAVAVLLPLICTAFPIYKSCTRSVKDGLFEKVGSAASGLKPGKRRRQHIIRNSKLLIPISNLLRKRTRTMLAMLALLTGGVLFMTAQNIIASIDKTVDVSMRNFRWDYNVILAGQYREEELDAVLKSIDGLDRYEIWGAGSMLLAQTSAADSVYCPVKIIPDNSKLVSSYLTDNLAETNGTHYIVINNGIADDEKWIKPGMTVKVTVNGHSADVVVSAIVTEVPALPAAYMTADTFRQLFGGNAGQIILSSADTRALDNQRAITKNIEVKFNAAGIDIAENLNIYVLREAFVDHLFVVITFLTAISMMSVAVGGLSIGSAIGINVAERKREAGVLRAIGASRRQIVSMVLLEVLTQGIISWIAGAALSYPVSQWVGNYFGQIFIGINLQNTLSLPGVWQWLIISVTVSLLAGLLPAWKTAAAPLRMMLEYE